MRTALVPLLGSGGVAASCWLVAGLRPFTAASAWAVVVLGAGAFVAGCYRRGGVAASGRPPGRAIGAWVALFGAMAAWELAAWSSSPRAEHPTLSSLADAVLEGRAARAAALAGWVFAAFGLGRLGARAQ